MIEHPSAVLHRLDEEIQKSGTQKAFAEKHGLSPAFICDVVHGRRDVTDRLAEALDFKRVTLWKDLRDMGRRTNQK